VPRVKTLRRALALTQEEFAARYHIPLGTLRDWEQGRSEPDQPAKAYLTVIARDPEGVERALQPVTACNAPVPVRRGELHAVTRPEVPFHLAVNTHPMQRLWAIG